MRCKSVSPSPRWAPISRGESTHTTTLEILDKTTEERTKSFCKVKRNANKWSLAKDGRFVEGKAVAAPETHQYGVEGCATKWLGGDARKRKVTPTEVAFSGGGGWCGHRTITPLARVPRPLSRYAYRA